MSFPWAPALPRGLIELFKSVFAQPMDFWKTLALNLLSPASVMELPMQKPAQAQSDPTDLAIAVPEDTSAPVWAPWVLALLIYAIYAVIASPALASIAG